MVTNYAIATRRPVLHLIVSCNRASRICISRNLVVKEAGAAPFQWLRTEVTDLRFIALGEEITNSSPTS